MDRDRRPPGGGRPPHERGGADGKPQEKPAEMNIGMRGGPGRRMDMPVSKPKNISKTAKRLMGYLGKDIFRLVIVFICVILHTVFNLIASYMIRPITNGLVEGGDSAVLVQNLLLMGSVYAISLIAHFFQIRLMVSIAQGALQRLRNDLFEKMQKLPIKYYDTNNNGDLMSRFTNDVDSVGEMMSNTAISLISGVITLVGTLIIMIYTNVLLTLVTLVMVPIFYFGGKFVTSKSRKYYKGRQATLGELNGYIEETITGQKVVKVFNHEEDAFNEFKQYNKNYREKVVKAQFYGGIMGPFMGGLGHLNYVLTALIGGFVSLLGNIDVGAFIVFLNYSRTFSRPINEISMQMNVIYSAVAGAERVFDMMDEKPEKQDEIDAIAPKKLDGFIRLTDVDFGYRPDKLVLKNVSLYAKPGQKIAFVGSTGAGKTTITNLINRFYDIQKGSITIDDVDIKKYRMSYLRQNISMVLQDTHLFEGTVMENIRYGRLNATNEDVKEAAKAANAHSFICRLENGYNTILESDGANLSQGQRQLLNIARAAISNAPILILDEATSSVDTRTEKHIEEALDRLMESRTTLVIAHRLSTVRNANAIIVLENGEIIERGNHAQLIDIKGRYYQLYEGLAKLS